eukprot:GEMP01040134.1.p1 GENE.GEMP01040134.1~~GEMP01040134.1.p1  ORF type:complete len:229 (+),score=64.27 GEMP01040134.1:171-857(+)
MTGSKNVAVVLAGCGVYDGSEVQESVFILSALSKAGATVQCFAPDIKQHHVIDHTAGKEMAEERNVLKESARICRGQVKPLTDLKAADYDALIFSGGFGAAKNLSDFAFKGAEVTVEAQTARVIQEFYDAKKALGFSCIAPVLAAKVLGCHGIELTVGSDVESKSWPNAGAAGAVTALGAKHVVTEHKAHVDSKNKVVSSSAYMCDTAPVHVIQESVESMVNETIKLA